MSNFGSDYATAYDAMYEDKDYLSECAQLEWAFQEFGTFQIRSILDIGCGTGKHSWELAKRGYEVTGIDRSANMLEQAINQPIETSKKREPVFKLGDAVDFTLGQEFDAVIMMFAVISYLDSNDSLLMGLKNVTRHLKPGGLFLADFWYGPGVLTDRPQRRSHKRALGNKTVERRVTPKMNLARNTCSLKYDVVINDSEGNSHTATEEHVMRYLFGPELELALSVAGLDLLHLGRSNNWQCKLEEADWTGSLIARRL